MNSNNHMVRESKTVTSLSKSGNVKKSTKDSSSSHTNRPQSSNISKTVKSTGMRSKAAAL